MRPKLNQTMFKIENDSFKIVSTKDYQFHDLASDLAGNSI